MPKRGRRNRQSKSVSNSGVSDRCATGITPLNRTADAAQHGLRLEVVKHHEAKRGFVLLPRRWVVERSFAWAARFRRLARDYERLASTLAGYHWLAFATLMLHSALCQKCMILSGSS